MMRGGPAPLPEAPPLEGEATAGDLEARLVLRLLGWLRPYAFWLLAGLGAILAGATARQAGPYLTKIGVDDYLLAGDAEGFGSIVLLYAALLGLQFVLGYVQGWTTNMVGQWAMRDLRRGIFNRLQWLPLRFYDRTPVGRLMARNTSDVDALNELYTDGLVTLVSDLFTLLAILGFIFYMDPGLGLVTSLCLPLAFLATALLQRRTYRCYQEARGRFGDFAAALQEGITGMEVVQLFGTEDRRSRRFQESNDEYLRSRLTATVYHSAYFPVMELSGGLMLGVVLWYGTGQVLSREMEWGVLVAMLQYVPRFFMPLRSIAEGWQVLQTAMASSERIFELLDTEEEPTGAWRGPNPMLGRIEFRDVWFAYDGGPGEEEWVLRGVSFAIEPGQSLAVVGATGAGKSTLVNLLCRFYEVQRGEVRVDGVDVRDWDVRDLRRRIGLVQQDVFLFAGSLADNIALGAGSDGGPVPRERIVQAARDTNADRFIDRLPDGYDQAVGERGVSLSAGQRQLLSFARVLAAGPEVLVLDEATANIDTETEMWIQEAVGRMMGGRTSLAIAHRLSTVRKADAILVLHRGQVRELGRHEELLARGGLYHRLHQLQYGGQESTQEQPQSLRATGGDGS